MGAMEPKAGLVRLVVVSKTSPSDKASHLGIALAAIGVLVALAMAMAGCGSDSAGPAVVRNGVAEVPAPTASTASPPAESGQPADQSESSSGASVSAVRPDRQGAAIPSDPVATAAPELASTPAPATALGGRAGSSAAPEPASGLPGEPSQGAEVAAAPEAGQIAFTIRPELWGKEHPFFNTRWPAGSWLLPWQEGFLHVGYGFTGQRADDAGTGGQGYVVQGYVVDFSRLLFSASSDGVGWAEPRVLPVPEVHFPVPVFEDWASRWSPRWSPCEYGYCTALVDDPDDCVALRAIVLVECRFTGRALSTTFDVISTGDRLIVGSQWQDKVQVSVTGDLVEWDTTEITLPRQEGIHESLSSASRAMSIEVGPNGWLLRVETLFYFDFIQMVPADIAETALRVEIQQGLYCEEGGEYTGQKIKFSTKHRQVGDEERCLSWEDESIPRGLYRAYGTFGNKPYPPHERYSGSVWSATWGNTPVRSALPAVDNGAYGSGTCCTIVGTGEGYLAIEDTSGPGYGPGWGVPTELFYSKDGIVWTSLDHPAGESAWIHEAIPLRDGIYFESTITIGHGATEEHSEVWVSALDGSNWRKLELPEKRKSPFWRIPDTEDIPTWRSPEFMPNVDGTRLGNRYLAINGDTAIWFGPKGTIERLLIDQRE